MPKLARTAAALIWVSLQAATTLVGQAAPRVAFSADTVRVDEALVMSATGLEPGVRATLGLTQITPSSVWKSEAEFVADADGRIDASRMAATGGSYEGVDPMGLFWSGVRVPGAPPDGEAAAEGTRLAVLTVLVDEGVVGADTVVRLTHDPRIVITSVTEVGLVASFHRPPGDGPFPGILAMGGSECGLQSAQTSANELATYGYAALALAYCVWPGSGGTVPEGMEALPRGLENVPLEYVEAAIAWLAAHPDVDAARLGVRGGSKGAELALLVASSNPELQVVIASVPSHVSWQGITGGRSGGPSWTRGGEPYPYVPYTSDAELIARYSGGAASEIAHMYRASLDVPDVVEPALIPVERINGPILLLSGKDDLLWPSAYMAEQLVERLRENGFEYEVVHLSYENAGHALRRPYGPTTHLPVGGSLKMGGTPDGYARASEDLWPELLAFLDRHLHQQP